MPDTQDPPELTHRQQQYLDELTDGPKTTRDLVLSLVVSGHSAAKMMAKLRDMGLVRSKRVPMQHGNLWRHELTERPSDETHTR